MSAIVVISSWVFLVVRFGWINWGTAMLIFGDRRKFLFVWFDVLLWFLLQSFGLLELAFLED